MKLVIKTPKLAVKLNYDDVFSEIVKRGRVSCRQLAKHFGVGFVRMSRFLEKVQLANDRVRTEYVRVGDGYGQPNQELLYYFKPPKEDRDET